MDVLLKQKKTFTRFFLFIISFNLIGCSQNPKQQETVETNEKAPMAIEKRSFGQTPDGQEITEYTLSNESGVSVSVINYGGIVTSIITPDQEGNPGDVVLGFDDIDGYASEEYLASGPYFGALIGRYGNRIAEGKFTLEGEEYTLATNNGNNHLHGGDVGFDKVIWQVEEVDKEGAPALKLSYLSKDGEERYPGNLQVNVVYTLTDDNELKIDYEAETDKATPINLTNHSYFNLAAGEAENALGHILTINADKFTVVNEVLIPTGELRLVEETPMDFTEPQAIGSRIEKVEGGYDHNYVLNKDGDGMTLAATVYDPLSGREMEVRTTEPGVQFYSGNFLDGSFTRKEGQVYNKHYGFCLETQHFPDSPNQPDFPSTILNPGETYTSSTIYKFSTRE